MGVLMIIAYLTTKRVIVLDFVVGIITQVSDPGPSWPSCLYFVYILYIFRFLLYFADLLYLRKG